MIVEFDSRAAVSPVACCSLLCSHYLTGFALSDGGVSCHLDKTGATVKHCDGLSSIPAVIVDSVPSCAISQDKLGCQSRQAPSSLEGFSNDKRPAGRS